ncbi:leucine-rich repeat domain-containing protein [Xylanibacter muris]|uniref:Leucine-rich repeat domain-containing protein n=1 Tax=Xylanibacter muris TaxID=2736290 RepID=A0ABX2AJJ6_9BACT|nr:leucine-rich repeat domain-containing protein [Xylanibacter muris]NPD90973.1 leucine-rich repeat domain-containing protein [Xylanibacter muris]
MKKIFTLALLAVLTLSVTAATDIKNFSQLRQERHQQLKPAVLKKAGKRLAFKTNAKAAGNAPESITGKSFITVYNDQEDKFNGFFNVVADGEGIILEGFAEGYNVKASYDASTGTITIPTGVVIGKSNTYGDITIHAAASDGYSDDPIIGTVDGNKVTFNYGVYGTVVYEGQQGGLILMLDIDGNEANAKMTFQLEENTYQFPLLATKTADDKISIVGINTPLTAGYFYNVPMAFNATSKTATIQSEQPIGHNMATNGSNIKNVYYMFNRTAEGLTRNPAFTITATDNSSTVKAQTDVFIGYDTNGAGSYRGFTMSGFQISLDYNIFTQPTTDDPYADATTATVNGITYDLDNDTKTATVTGCLGNMKEIDIPASIEANGNTYTVTAIMERAFYANRAITEIHIPASIKTVGNDAFRNLANLKSLYIENLEAWCAIEFYNGNANPLYNVFPTSTSKWGKVYINGTETTEIVVPEGVTKIGRAFYGFKSLTSITLPSTLKELGDQAMANCVSLTTVIIPEGVESTGSSFWGCENLTEISVPGSIKSLGRSMFYGCKNLKSVNLAEGIERIGMMAFSGCTALETITLPSTIKSVELMGFYACTGLKEIKSLNTIPPTCLSDDVFEDCATATLYVPETSVEDYKTATGWKIFAKIEPVNTSGVDKIESNGIKTPVKYYNLQGVRVAEEDITPGIYVIHKDGKAVKAYIK